MTVVVQDSNHSGIYALRSDGSLRKLVDCPENQMSVLQSFAWAPSGQLIAFDVAWEPPGDSTDYEGIHILNLSTGADQRISRVGRRVDDLAWSPDGSRLAYVILNEAGSNREIRVIAADGSRPATVVETGVGWPSSPTWSSDGERLAYAVRRLLRGPEETRPRFQGARGLSTSALSVRYGQTGAEGWNAGSSRSTPPRRRGPRTGPCSQCAPATHQAADPVWQKRHSASRHSPLSCVRCRRAAWVVPRWPSNRCADVPRHLRHELGRDESSTTHEAGPPGSMERASPQLATASVMVHVLACICPGASSPCE